MIFTKRKKMKVTQFSYLAMNGLGGINKKQKSVLIKFKIWFLGRK